jgi:hypothetical protein
MRARGIGEGRSSGWAMHAAYDHRMHRRRLLVRGGVVAAVVTTALTASVAAATRSGDLCRQVPTVTIHRNDLGFRVGWPTAAHAGARGHGKVNLGARTVSGIMCQVNRDGTAIVLSVGHRLLYASHHAVRFGVPGNIVKAAVRVTRTTDPNCSVGTRGKLTVFASYNNVHRDSVELSFPPACKGHRHRYTGPSVVTNVPPN